MPLEAYAQDIVDTVREPLLMLDTTLRVRSANRAFYQTFRVSPPETEHHLIYELGNGQWDIPALRTLLEDIVPKNTSFNDFNLEHTFPEIGRRVMLLNARKLKAGNHDELLVLAMEDITERRRAEEEVAKAAADLTAIETFSQNIVDTVREPLLMLDTTLRVHSANRAFYQTFQVSPAETEHHLIYELGNGQWDIPALRTLLEDIVPKNTSFNDFNLEHTFPEIGRRVMLLNARKLKAGNHGELLVLAMEDITARQQAEEAVQMLKTTLEIRIQERTAQLEEAVKELEAFSYSVSHDLRAPLRAVDGYARILLTDFASELPEEARGYLDRVKANAEHMGQLIDDLLTFSRLNRQPVRRLMILPAALAQQALDELVQAGETHAAAVSIEPMPPCTGDPLLLLQVFTNLLSNALKFTARQPVPRITIGCQVSASPVQSVYFIQDNGVGFDMRYADKLFGVFHRLHRMEDYPGTGVGLALVQRIIHRHSGRIWAEAVPDQGATFFFTLGAGDNANESH